jgi:hypothetical protein
VITFRTHSIAPIVHGRVREKELKQSVRSSLWPFCVLACRSSQRELYHAKCLCTLMILKKTYQEETM